VPAPGHRPEDEPLHGIAGFARTGAMGSVVRRSTDGRGTDLCLLRGAYAVLDGTGSRSQDGHVVAVDRRNCEPQPGRVRAAFQRTSGIGGRRIETPGED